MQAMLDTLNDVRVRLAVENYSIQDITTSGPVYRIFESATRGELPGRTSYAGIPIAGSMTFTSDHPANTVMRLRLGGGPEHRAPPRIERQQAMMANFGLVYGGAERQAEIQRTNVPMPSAEATAADTTGFLEEMAPTPFVSKGTRWVNRSTGDIVEVDHLGRSTEGGEPVVHFKRVSDSLEVNTVLLQRDFETMFRPFTQEGNFKRSTESVVEVLKDEEWEHVESGEAVKIDSVDTKRNLVIVVAKDKRKSVPMLDFVNAKWRKIVRKTAFARILEDD